MMWIQKISGKGGMMSGSKGKASGLFESPTKSKLRSNGYDDEETRMTTTGSCKDKGSIIGI